MEKNINISAVILAAGFSSRMGEFKALLPIEGKPAIVCLIEEIKKSGILDIVVVTGHERERLSSIITGYGVNEAYNPLYKSGMFSSVRQGLKQVSPKSNGCFLLPVDYPLIHENILKKLITESQNAKSRDTESQNNGFHNDFIIPAYRGKKGHPLYIQKEYFSEIISYEGSKGLKGITDRYPDRMKQIPVDYEGIVIDMDSPEDYDKIKRFVANGFVSDDPVELARGRTFYLVRHGQIKQHEKKIFLGQADIPLSEQGEKEALACGKQLQAVRYEKVYTSPLKRAKETARLMAPGKKIIEVPDFIEMSLGSCWDGQFIDSIRKKYPDDYKLRGENIWTFKTGNNSENFYDLQYRVVKGLCKILRTDSNENIVIASHKGVIRAIENNLAGKSIDDDWQEINTGDIRVVTVKAPN